ncbi:hypothetical protein BV25DRAFT_1818594 [Artomyces pyxidatus]|uniref:Uncharacterized protein n=1 Tax=Artomyces pyxidatus TaxID=48021 RepID=A0ACB8TIA8_9AGAM|nr:hypothetical protein BV25DRAFT_1818594 [Artomyces pyxidatus]
MNSLSPPQHPSRRSAGRSGGSESSIPLKSPQDSPAASPKAPPLPLRPTTAPTVPQTQVERDHFEPPPRHPESPPQEQHTPSVAQERRVSPPRHPESPPQHQPTSPPASDRHVPPAVRLEPVPDRQIPPLQPPPERLPPDEGLTEAQLREQYENEEIERFFSLFKAHISEVKLPGATPAKDPILRETTLDAIVGEDVETCPIADDASTIHAVPNLSLHNRSTLSLNGIPDSWSKKVAYSLLPYLPPAPPPPPAFSLGRFRLTIQRLFIIFDEGYLPFAIRMKRLATWEDHDKSMWYCVVFWVLWFFNLILPAFFLNVLYTLLCRRLLSYPTLEELREHRRKVLHAEEFGDHIQARLLSPSSLGPRDMWRLAKMLPKLTKAKAKTSAKGKTGDSEDLGLNTESEEANMSIEETKQEQDMKRVGLKMMSEIADFHERLKNIFLWRQPKSSREAVLTVLLLFFATLMLPAQYLAKMVYFAGGFMFWHVTPVIMAIPPSELSRLPAPMHDVPTDTDVAMELISQRVARGLPVLPPRRPRARSLSPEASRQNVGRPESERRKPSEAVNDVDWKKWGGLAATGKAWASGSTRSGSDVGPSGQIETHTFPAQHISGPGLITITATSLYFTSLASKSPKITIPSMEVTGIKKSGMLKGLTISWTARTERDEPEDRTEVFRWVGGRDEVFARLIGSNGRKWVKS